MGTTLRKRYSPEEIERGLTTLVIAGNSFKASEILGVPDKTIREWKRKNLERYENLRTELHSKVAETIASEAESLALRISEKEGQVLDSLDEEAIARLSPNEKAATLRNLSTSKALQMDKISGPTRERPAYVQPSHSGLAALVANMERAMGFDASSTAEEIPPAQIVA